MVIPSYYKRSISIIMSKIIIIDHPTLNKLLYIYINLFILVSFAFHITINGFKGQETRSSKTFTDRQPENIIIE